MKVSTKIIEKEISLDCEDKDIKQEQELEQEDISELKHDNESIQMKVEIRINDEDYLGEEEEEEIEDQKSLWNIINSVNYNFWVCFIIPTSINKKSHFKQYTISREYFDIHIIFIFLPIFNPCLLPQFIKNCSI